MSERGLMAIGAAVGAVAGMMLGKFTAIPGYWPILITAACAALGAFAGGLAARR